MKFLAAFLLFSAVALPSQAQTSIRLFGRGLIESHGWILALACENSACDTARFVLSPKQGEARGIGPHILVPTADQEASRIEATRLKLMYFFATRYMNLSGGKSTISKSEAYSLVNRMTEQKGWNWSEHPQRIRSNEMKRLLNLIAGKRSWQLGTCSKYGQKILNQMAPLQKQGIDFRFQTVFQNEVF